MMYKIMLSYSRKNSAEREALYANLQRISGLEVIYDTKDISHGKIVRKSLSEIIQEADCLIALLTKEGIASIEVREEITRAHDRGKNIIPIVPEDVPIGELPWFIRDINIIRYRDTDFDSVLKSTIKSIQEFSQQKIRIKMNYSEISRDNTILSWDEWYEKIIVLSNVLKTGLDNGHFNPSAILGISNGGLIIADIIKRQVYSGEKPPVLSLWADRWGGEPFFNNSYNISTLKNIECEAKGRAISLLLIDDAVRSSNTITQAIEFIKSVICNNVNIVFSPLVCRNLLRMEPVSQFLPFSYEDGKAFLIGKEEYFSLIESSKSFPYKIF